MPKGKRENAKDKKASQDQGDISSTTHRGCPPQQRIECPWRPCAVEKVASGFAVWMGIPGGYGACHLIGLEV